MMCLTRGTTQPLLNPLFPIWSRTTPPASKVRCWTMTGCRTYDQVRAGEDTMARGVFCLHRYTMKCETTAGLPNLIEQCSLALARGQATCTLIVSSIWAPPRLCATRCGACPSDTFTTPPRVRTSSPIHDNCHSTSHIFKTCFPAVKLLTR